MMDHVHIKMRESQSYYYYPRTFDLTFLAFIYPGFIIDLAFSASIHLGFGFSLREVICTLQFSVYCHLYPYITCTPLHTYKVI
jgi:hypothetical protein